MDLSHTNLKKVNFIGANLKGANLRDTDLSNAFLQKADLRDADISGANLYNAKLSDAKLEGIKYDYTTQYFAMQCPEKGEFVAYKKAYDSELGLSCIVKLLIPADALRSSATTNKCRCNKAKVLSITSTNGKRTYRKAYSFWDHFFVYEEGKTVKIPNFNKDRWQQCTFGIHFFMDRKDAIRQKKIRINQK